MAMFQYFKRVDGQYPGSKLPRSTRSRSTLSFHISAANTEVALLQPLLHKEVPRGSMHPKRVGRHDIHGPSLERRK